MAGCCTTCGREPRGLGNLPFAILGLVECHPEGVHGYRLKQNLECVCDEAEQLGYGRVYGTLEWLAARGELVRTDHIQHDRPNRKVYRITESGSRTLEEWLLRPVCENPRPIRNELGLKVLFLGEAERAALQQHIELQRRTVLSRIAQIERRRKRLEKTDLPCRAIDLVLAGPRMRLQAELAWLTKLEVMPASDARR